MNDRQLSPFIKISLDNQSFDYAVQRAFSGLDKVFKSSSDNLDKIAAKLNAKLEYIPQEHDILKLKKKFLYYCSQSSRDVHYFESKEIRDMCYCITEIIDFKKSNIDKVSRQLSLFKDLLYYNWNERFLSPLAHFMLAEWDKMRKYKFFHEFIWNKIKDYKGTRKKLLAMKQHINFLSLYNYKNFGKYLRHNGINLIFAAAMFGLKKENLSYPYFHGVLLSYYSSVESMDDIFEECLNLCNSHEIRRIALAQLIADIDGKENRYENNKNKLKILALKHIGLPENDNAWILSEAASFDSKEKIKKAREILRRWITQQYIDVVFNELMNDKRRADFWKQFAGCIDNFKVVGGDNVRTIINTHLKNTNTQAHYLYAKSPKRYRDFTALAAFIMWIGNRIFIEFSDTANALYVYSEQIWKTISWSEIPELKKQEWKRGGHMLNAYNNAGRFLHSGNWEYRLKSWLKLKLGVFPDSEKRR